ncbi:MAG: MarR family winged helix-turn-helix transcriptional regulator [Candidatus Fonsibacter sp.]
MKDLLYLTDKSLKEVIELIFQAYIDSYSDPYEVLKKNSFGRAHHRLLCIIEGNPNISIADILRKLKITKQSLSRVLQDLIKKKIISQKKGTKDARQRELQLTEEGLNLCNIIFNKQKKRIYNALKTAGPDEVTNFKNVMRKIIDG